MLITFQLLRPLVQIRWVGHLLWLMLAFAHIAIAGEIQWFPQQARFAPDDSHLLVNVCEVDNMDYCRIWRYDMADNKWSALPMDKDRTYMWPSYSPDSKQIVLSTMPCPQRKCDLREARLALMNADGTGLRAIPGPERIRTRPSFSPDGKRLIFWQTDEIFKIRSGYVLFQHAYEKDLGSGAERRLTHYSATRVLSSPKYWPDGKRFMFSARDFYFLPDDSSLSPEQRVVMFRSRPKETGHMVFVLDLQNRNQNLEPLFNSPRNWSVAFDVSRDGRKLLYASSAATSAYGSLYMRDPVNLSEPVLLLKENGLSNVILDATFSVSGHWAIAIRHNTGDRVHNARSVELWLMGADGSGQRKIELEKIE